MIFSSPALHDDALPACVFFGFNVVRTPPDATLLLVGYQSKAWKCKSGIDTQHIKRHVTPHTNVTAVTFVCSCARQNPHGSTLRKCIFEASPLRSRRKNLASHAFENLEVELLNDFLLFFSGLYVMVETGRGVDFYDAIIFALPAGRQGFLSHIFLAGRAVDHEVNSA